MGSKEALQMLIFNAAGLQIQPSGRAGVWHAMQILPGGSLIPAKLAKKSGYAIFYRLFVVEL